MARKKKSKEDLEFDKYFSEEEQLSIENDILKLKIETELGGKMQTMGEMELPPEIENLFLNQIYNFHQQHLNSKKIPLFNYLGEPAFKQPSEIKTKREMKSELKKLMKVMKKSGVVLDTICEYDDREIYTFIIDHLFKIEVDDIKLENGSFHFIYEEFCPNHEFDLSRYTEKIIEYFFHPTGEFIDLLYHNKIRLNKSEMDNIDFKNYIENIKEFLPEIEMTSIDQVDFEVEKKKARTMGAIHFKDQPMQQFVFYFLYEDKMWRLNSVELEILKTK